MNKWLISAEQLHTQMNRGNNVVVVDCRFSLADVDEGERLYRQLHICGAHYLHLDRDLSGEKKQHGGRHPLPNPECLAQKLRLLGVGNKTLVVAYDDNGLVYASRLWWLLRYLGHDHVKVLDGGFSHWQSLQLPLSSSTPCVTVGDLVARPRFDMAVDINTVKTIPLMMGAVLVDAREQARFLGQIEPIDPIAGHINGAVNIPWQGTINHDSFFLDASRQAALWGGIKDKEELVVYCGSGVTACVNLLSLAVVGREDAKLYAGSWSDWCSYL